MGDFNLPSIEWLRTNDRCIAIQHEGRMANEFLNMLCCNEMKQTNHIRNTYNRTLDLVITNKLNIQCKKTIGMVNEDLNHPALCFKIDSVDVKFMKMKKPSNPNFFKANYQAINSELCNIDWVLKLNHQDIDKSVELFYSTVNSIIHKHTPKSKSHSADFPIWFSDHLIRLVRDKEVYFKLKNQTNDPLHLTLYKTKRKEIKREKKRCLKQYETSIEEKIKSNPKAFFSYTKSLHKSNCLPLVMRYKDKLSENMKETADLFANCFANVYSRSNSSYHARCDNNCANYFPLTEDDIRATILSMDRNKVHSPDAIPTMFYYHTLPNITKPLLMLFEKSLEQMKYPSAWKISHLTPTFKSGDVSNAENYRPISILRQLPKYLTN